MAVRVMNERLKAKNSITIIVAIVMEILGSRGKGLIGIACQTRAKKLGLECRNVYL